ncbi:putative membrane protein [Granulicella aggregans]|uniref:Putative membrane protein n=1 Tax=Granulicella aggregans TaxID=474949 RepID=A0A7W7ZCE3_9BACT|nr:FG-GAP-like repeat-containing protein [Granulicella aggregans]MBB5057330.1 putative membrane protein [Granulicella aggregans]
MMTTLRRHYPTLTKVTDPMKTLIPNPDSTTSFSMKSAKVRLTEPGRLRALLLCVGLAVSMSASLAMAQTAPPTPQTVIVGDFNGDGIPDALVESTVTPTATIAFGSVPYGTFASGAKAVTFPSACVSFNSDSLVVGDFNGDGIADIAYFCNGTSGVKLGNGDGTFATAKSLAGAISANVVAGDFNKDGKLDLVVLGLTFGPNTTTLGTLQFFAGNGDGTFQTNKNTVLDQFNYTAPTVADLKGDGYPDIVLLSVPDGGAPSVNVFGNNPDGTFGAITGGVATPNTLANVSTGASTILVGNFFGPLTVDLAVVSTGVNGVFSVLQNTSTATAYSFNDPVTIPYANLTGAQAGKFTGSGFTDVVASNGASISVLTNDGKGNLAASYAALSLASTSSNFAVADANGDGYADVYTAALPQTGALKLGVALTSGTATATSQPISLAAGTRAIGATWAGNVNFTGSSATGSQIVIGASSVTTLASSKNPSLLTGSVTFTVHVGAGPNSGVTQTPTGTVVLKDGTATLASGSVDGTGTYTYTTTALTQATHVITANYAGDGTFAASTATLSQVVNHAAVVSLTWATPAAIVYGTALSGAQLNATAVDATGAAIPGVFVYTPAAGTVLGAGTQTLSVTFTPTDLLSFTVATKTLSLVVSKANPVITWATPANIAYGTALGATQLNAIATGASGAAIPGVFVYTPAAGTVLGAGTQTLSVTFTPTDLLSFTVATKTVSLVVSKANPVITWATPASVSYGTALSATQLNATATGVSGAAIPGVFVYTPAAGTVLGAGTQTLSVTFTPTDLLSFTVATKTVSLVVSKANPVITWATPASVAYGTALSATQLNATATGVTGAALPGVFTYTPAAGTVPAPGTRTLSVSFTATNAVDYNVGTATVNLVVTGLTVSSFSPTTVTLGSGATTVTITGAGFVSNSVVQVNGTAIPTTLVNPTTLTAVIPASDLLTVGTLQITVLDPTVSSTSTAVTLTVTAPPVTVVLTAPPTVTPGTQPTIDFTITQPYPVDITATLTLGFAASTTPAVDDPSIQFDGGGRTLTFVVPANTVTVPTITLQAGTVAGTITVPITLTAGGTNVTPADLGPAVIVVPPSIPTISSVTATRSGSQLTVVMHGFSNTREMVNAKFHFTPAAGATLDTTDLTITADTIFNTNWFQTTPSDQYGSTFTYTQIFNTSNDATTIGSVDVTLTNTVGPSDKKTTQ